MKFEVDDIVSPRVGVTLSNRLDVRRLKKLRIIVLSDKYRNYIFSKCRIVEGTAVHTIHPEWENPQVYKVNDYIYLNDANLMLFKQASKNIKLSKYLRNEI